MTANAQRDYWATCFDPEAIRRALGLDTTSGLVMDIGCGYGTFSIPVARLMDADVLAIDIDLDLIATVIERVLQE